MKSYKFKLFPNKEQEDKLDLALDISRQTYNYLLSLFSSTSEGFNEGEMKNYLRDLKVVNEDFKNKIYSTSLQVECEKIHDNLSVLSSLKKKGKKVGRLRYKGKGWKKTFVYKQSGFKILKKSKNNSLYLSKIGNIKMILHRKVEGDIKQLIIKKEVDNWYVIFQTDAVIKNKCGRKVVGIDMSPSKFGIRSDKIIMEMPKEIDVSLSKLKKCNRNMSRKKKGSKNRFKARKLLQKRYWRLNNQKHNFYHQISVKLVKDCKVIGIETLSIKGMMMGYYSAVNFQKSGWATFINKYLIYKAESAGCQVWACDRFEPTSKKCSGCGNINKELKLSDRTYECSKCGLIIDRDLNASINIKKTCRLGTNLCGVDTSLDSEKDLKVSVRNLKYGRKQEKISNCS